MTGGPRHLTLTLTLTLNPTPNLTSRPAVTGGPRHLTLTLTLTLSLSPNYLEARSDGRAAQHAHTEGRVVKPRARVVVPSEYSHSGKVAVPSHSSVA